MCKSSGETRKLKANVSNEFLYCSIRKKKKEQSSLKRELYVLVNSLFNDAISRSENIVSYDRLHNE
jgi:hypothetical protein